MYSLEIAVMYYVMYVRSPLHAFEVISANQEMIASAFQNAMETSLPVSFTLITKT